MRQVGKGTLSLLEARGADAARWEEALAPMPGADIYFTPAWARLFAELDGDRPLCALWEGDRGKVLFPLQLRSLNRLPFWTSRWLGATASTPAFDATSPYGYSGPLAQTEDPAETPRIVMEFMDALGERLRAERVVSLFIRFHPLAGNAEYFPQETIDLGKRSETVFIDLTAPWYKSLTSACRYEIRKSERRGVTVEQASGPGDWEAFGDLYRDTMTRRSARSWYIFPQAFLEETRRLLSPAVTLLVARHEGKVAGGALFLEGFGKGHYHLSGADSGAAGLGVTNRLVVEGARLCETHGCRVLHLGGGVGGGDGLARFKASFSPLRARWDKACVVTDPETYERLVLARAAFLAESGARDEGSDAFPAYRRGWERLTR